MMADAGQTFHHPEQQEKKKNATVSAIQKLFVNVSDSVQQPPSQTSFRHSGQALH